MPFKIILFFRKSRNTANFSIETYFNELVPFFPSSLQLSSKTSSYESSGFWKRIYIAVEAIFRQGDINHITGDVHFLTLLLRKKKTILTIHDCWFMRHPSALARIIFKWFWLKLPIWRSAIVTAVSEASKKEIVFYSGCNPDKIRVIHTSVSLMYASHPKSFNKQKPEMLHIGTAENKNLERLIPALEGLSCVLNIIGKLSPMLIELLDRYKIEYKNSYTISNEEMLNAYISCDLLCFVSTLEGFGMPIIEANRVERAVVTSNVSSMPDIAGASACLVDPFDVHSIREGILKVINDDSYREKLIATGKKNKERFLPDSIAQQYYFLYMELLNLNKG